MMDHQQVGEFDRYLHDKLRDYQTLHKETNDRYQYTRPGGPDFTQLFQEIELLNARYETLVEVFQEWQRIRQGQGKKRGPKPKPGKKGTRDTL